MPTFRRAIGPTCRFFADASAGSAELKLNYALEANLEIALLVGAPGLGKTTVLRRFANHAAATGHIVADVFFPQLGADDLLAFIDGELAATEESAGRDRQVCLRRIARRARRLGRENRGLVIVIDDAHLLTDRDALETLQSLLNLRDRESVQLTIVLAGETALLANLARVPALAGRVGVTAVLSPLELDHARDYVRHCVQTAGKPPVTFCDDALRRLHQETAGNLRSINRFLDMTMVLARANGRANVTLDDVECLAGEMGARSEAA